MGKTKAEEREALAKIKEILKDFSPKDTHIGKAFEDCVKQAEKNICNDEMFSWRDQYRQYMEEQLKNCRLSDKVEALTETLNRKDDTIARLEDAKNQLGKDLEGVKVAYAKLEYKLERAKETADRHRQTILELKAKLYDMMVSRKEVIHSDEEG